MYGFTRFARFLEGFYRGSGTKRPLGGFRRISNLQVQGFSVWGFPVPGSGFTDRAVRVYRVRILHSRSRIL